MDPVARALWFIESHIGGEITLDDIAQACGVSRFHLSRAFSATLGRSIMRYLRARRLTEAARALAAGAPDILSIALGAGYASHEAFTRAFRDQFRMTPEQLRAKGELEGLELVEPILMEQNFDAKLEPPRFVDAKALLIAGLAQRYEYEDMDGIPSQWERFQPYIGQIPREIGGAAFGVIANSDDKGFDYVCGVEVSDFSDIDPSLTKLRLSPQRYAVFVHRGHVASVRNTMHAVWRDWLPKSGHTAADAPSLERYGKDFDPRTGLGGLELWLPLGR
ncbi:MAG TPA: AraC family transcriptional regulator [Rhizobiaceae bacterium]|nr:AraC family transcriptional regulator [Rhizobiaceae bacterium]